MSKFCSNCGQQLDDNAVFCNNCGNSLSNQVSNNNTENTSFSKKKVKFHWGIPFTLFIQFIIVKVIYSTFNIISNVNSNDCIENCDNNSIFMNIINFINRFSTILAIFIIPSLIAVIIIYVVQKGKEK